jgi:hypothetical protein
MATTLSGQFESTLERIGIKDEAARKAELDVRAKLEADKNLQEWGVDTILIGSFARKTSIYPCHDADVFVRLQRCNETNPETVFSEVQRVLVAAYGSTRATEQRRSMKVDGFEGDDGVELSVDAVPAVPVGDHWQIPQTGPERIQGRWVKDQWEETKPERVTEISRAVNSASPSVNGRSSYLHVVRFVRQIRETHLADNGPSGFYFELLTQWSFRSKRRTETSYAELLAGSLAEIATELESARPLIEPGMGRAFTPAPTQAERTAAASKFRSLAISAGAALQLDECSAAVAWRVIFGEAPKVAGPAFPLPLGCTEDGRRISSITANPDRGSDRERGFA